MLAGIRASRYYAGPRNQAVIRRRIVMQDQRYIAVDLGAESGRVMLATVSKAGIALSEMHRFPNGPVRLGNVLHWDILRLWGEIWRYVLLLSYKIFNPS